MVRLMDQEARSVTGKMGFLQAARGHPVLHQQSALAMVLAVAGEEAEQAQGGKAAGDGNRALWS